MTATQSSLSKPQSRLWTSSQPYRTNELDRSAFSPKLINKREESCKFETRTTESTSAAATAAQDCTAMRWNRCCRWSAHGRRLGQPARDSVESSRRKRASCQVEGHSSVHSGPP